MFLDNMLSRYSVREFSAEKPSAEIMENIFEVASRTATSCGLQAVSIVNVTDPQIQLEISKVCNQSHVAKAPKLFIFVIDALRNKALLESISSQPHYADGFDLFVQSACDAVLMAQRIEDYLVNIGMGGCYLGSILNDPARIVELLHLPKYTFPIMGMTFGYPASPNQLLKPRMNMSLRVFENKYEEKAVTEFSEYQMQTANYYADRASETGLENAKTIDFNEVIRKRLQSDLPKRRNFLQYVKQQGFDLGLD